MQHVSVYLLPGVQFCPVLLFSIPFSFVYFCKLFGGNKFFRGVFLIHQNEKKKQNKTKQILFQLLKSIHTGALFSFSADDFITNRCLKLLHFVLNQTSFS